MQLSLENLLFTTARKPSHRETASHGYQATLLWLRASASCKRLAELGYTSEATKLHNWARVKHAQEIRALRLPADKLRAATSALRSVISEVQELNELLDRNHYRPDIVEKLSAIRGETDGS